MKNQVRYVVNSLDKLRPRMSHSSLLTFSRLSLILFVVLVIRMFPIRWELQTGLVYVSEFDAGAK